MGFSFFSAVSVNMCPRSMWRISSKHLTVLFLVAAGFGAQGTLACLAASAPADLRHGICWEADGVETELCSAPVRQTSDACPSVGSPQLRPRIGFGALRFVVASHWRSYCYFHVLLSALPLPAPLPSRIFCSCEAQTVVTARKRPSLPPLPASMVTPRQTPAGVSERSLSPAPEALQVCASHCCVVFESPLVQHSGFCFHGQGIAEVCKPTRFPSRLLHYSY